MGTMMRTPTHRISRPFSRLLPKGTPGTIKKTTPGPDLVGENSPLTEREVMDIVRRYPHTFYPILTEGSARALKGMVAEGVLVRPHEIEEIE